MEQVAEFENQTGVQKFSFIRVAWDVLINNTGLTFMVFTEKFDLAVNLYTVPRNTVYWCTVHNNTALASFVALHNEHPIL
jgi:hypothetical protein